MKPHVLRERVLHCVIPNSLQDMWDFYQNLRPGSYLKFIGGRGYTAEELEKMDRRGPEQVADKVIHAWPVYFNSPVPSNRRIINALLKIEELHSKTEESDE